MVTYQSRSDPIMINFDAPIIKCLEGMRFESIGIKDGEFSLSTQEGVTFALKGEFKVLQDGPLDSDPSMFNKIKSIEIKAVGYNNTHHIVTIRISQDFPFFLSKAVYQLQYEFNPDANHTPCKVIFDGTNIESVLRQEMSQNKLHVPF